MLPDSNKMMMMMMMMIKKKNIHQSKTLNNKTLHSLLLRSTEMQNWKNSGLHANGRDIIRAISRSCIFTAPIQQFLDIRKPIVKRRKVAVFCDLDRLNS